MTETQPWPPLEQVREWAEAKARSGREPPEVTGKYKNLIALIDEILTAKNASDSSSELPRLDH
ncbi:MAG: hypothetical protein ABI645_06965 [Pseudomonadota bacterium]